MAKIWEPQGNEVYRSWVNAIINEAQDKLSEWETNFVNSIENQLDMGRTLSQRQAEILERIYADKTS